MTWDTIQQLIRIVANAAGTYFLGAGIATGDLYQAAIGGVVAIAQFVWWMIYQRAKLTSE